MIDALILQYPDAMMSAVLGLQEILRMANTVEERRGGPERFRPRVVTLEEIKAGEEVAETDADRTLVLLPPSFEGDFYREADPALSGWLRRRHDAGNTLCSACAGAFFLGHAGLLEGRPATTHWGLAVPFLECFPGVALNIDKIVINDGDIVTAGGLMSWIDLGLEIVAVNMGGTVMREVGHRMVIDTAPREQRYYQRFQPPLTHGDAAILKAQRHMSAHLSEPLRVRDLAALAILGERTFLRRFARTTGLRPLQYLQRLRIQRACELLEDGADTVDTIALKVGYEDANAFRKAFGSVMGLTPKAFRARFASR